MTKDEHGGADLSRAATTATAAAVADGEGAVSDAPTHSRRTRHAPEEDGAEKDPRLARVLVPAFLLLFLAGAALAWVFRDSLFYRDRRDARELIAEQQRQNAERRQSEPGGGSIGEAFQRLRQAILLGNFARAEDGLAGLTRRSGLTRPRADWIRFHLILASLLNQDLDNAQAVVETQLKAGPFSTADADRALADSLQAIVQAFGKPVQAIPANAAKRFQKDGPEALAPLLFGLKNLEIGVADDGLRLLLAFLETRPTGAVEWIADYRPLAEQRIHDLKLFIGLRDRLKGADTTAKREALLEAVERDKDQLQGGGGKTTELLDGLATVLRTQLESTRKDEAGGAAARETRRNDADKGRWQAIREVAQTSVQLFRFDEALVTLNGLNNLHGDDFRAARNVLKKRVARLGRFKRMLVADLNTGAGRDWPLPARDGTTYPQGVVHADDQGLRAATAQGEEVRLAWTDVEPLVLVRLADHLADTQTADDPQAAAERRWLAATFAREFGLFDEARALAKRAADDRPELRDHLDQFR